MVKPQPYMVPFLKSTFRFTKWGSLFDMKGVEGEIKRRTNDSNDFNNLEETSKIKSGPSSNPIRTPIGWLGTDFTR